MILRYTSNKVYLRYTKQELCLQSLDFTVLNFILKLKFTPNHHRYSSFVMHNHMQVLRAAVVAGRPHSPPAPEKHDWSHPLSNKSTSRYSEVSSKSWQWPWTSTCLHLLWWSEVARGALHSLALLGWSWRLCSFMARPMLPAIFNLPWKKACK